MSKLSPAHRRLLTALADGWTLKSHRDVEGHKEYRLHSPDGADESAAWAIVEFLQEDGLIDSNKKFPAATFWLTEKGRAALDGQSHRIAPT